MRSNVLMYIGLILIVLTSAILLNITAKSAYAEAIRDSVESSLERSMSLVRVDAANHFQMYGLDDKVYGDVNFSKTTDEAALGKFKSDFVKIFAQDLDPKITNLTINIYGADPESGLLSVEVIADFTYLGGQTGRVNSYKTMILNKSINGDITPDMESP